MIEDKEMGLKVAENPEEALREMARENSEKRIREMKFTLELEGVILDYLKSKTKKN